MKAAGEHTVKEKGMEVFHERMQDFLLAAACCNDSEPTPLLLPTLLKFLEGKITRRRRCPFVSLLFLVVSVAFVYFCCWLGLSFTQLWVLIVMTEFYPYWGSSFWELIFTHVWAA